MKNIIFTLTVSILVICGNAVSEQTAPKSKNLWTNTVKDTPTGKEYTATLTASTGETSSGNPVKLIIKCAQGKSILAVNWGGYMPRGTKIPTDLRIGTGKVVSANWRVFNETDIAYADSPENILKQLTNSTTAIVRTTYFNSGIITAHFQLNGSNIALANIRQACHW